MFERITKPKDCLLAVAIPLTESDFYKDLRNEANKDFAKSRKNIYNFNDKQLWENDYLPLVNFIRQICVSLKNLGASVILNFESSQLLEISSYDVFTLLTHSANGGDEIELFDGLIKCEKFVELLPKSFKGTFDLTVCNSTFLQTKIKEKFNNIVIANKDKTSVQFRLLFYKNLMGYLSVNNINYVDAFTKLRIQLIKKKP